MPGSRILIIRLKSLGDILLAAVVPRAIAAARPEARIDFLIEDRYAGFTRNMPWISGEILRPRSWPGRAALAVRLRGAYDTVIDLHGSTAAALMARAASRGSVIGWSGKRCSALYTVRIPPAPPEAHTVEANLAFLAPLGIPAPARVDLVLEPDPALTAQCAARVGPRAVLLHPGARFAHKVWPGERFAELARRLESRGNRVWILQGPEDEMPGALASFPALRNTVPAELPAMMKAFDLFVGNDSGPMHVAAASGCRVVALFGPSDVNRWRPWCDRGRVIAEPCACGIGTQKPCLQPADWCMARITVDRVMEEIDRLP